MYSHQQIRDTQKWFTDRIPDTRFQIKGTKDLKGIGHKLVLYVICPRGYDYEDFFDTVKEYEETNKCNPVPVLGWIMNDV